MRGRTLSPIGPVPYKKRRDREKNTHREEDRVTMEAEVR